MLPGFRFLFAATFLSMSILVFGLGAAALLRAAHEQFASTPSWHAAPEPTFTQQVEATRPVLAMLRVEPPAAEQTTSGTPAIEPAAPAPAEPASAAELTQDAPENPAPSQMAAAPNDTPASDAPTLASTAQAAEPANEAIPAASEVDAASSSPASAPATPQADIASTTIAALDNPSVTVEPTPPAKTVSTKLDQSAIKKRLRARRAAYRRRMAARAARLALLAAQQQQQAANPFGQSFLQPRPAPATAPTRSH